MITCKISVLKCTFNMDFIDECVEEERGKTIGPCEVFHEGQEYITDGNFGMRYKRKELIIACCTDGTRPVIFKIKS